MSRSAPSEPWPGAFAPTDVPIADLTSDYRTDPPSGDGHGAKARLQIAVPANGSSPNFDNVYTLAVTGALLDQEVLVVCLTDETLTGWRRRLQARRQPLEGLALVDGQFGWSADWRAFFSSKAYDITVMHGIYAALKEQNIPISYARRLVDAVPRGLIVLA